MVTAGLVHSCTGSVEVDEECETCGEGEKCARASGAIDFALGPGQRQDVGGEKICGVTPLLVGFSRPYVCCENAEERRCKDAICNFDLSRKRHVKIAKGMRLNLLAGATG